MYLDHVRSLPCASCKAPAPSEAHHLIDVGISPGVGRKAPDSLSIPLCRTCHARLHAGDDLLHDSQLLMLARTVIGAALSGYSLQKDS